MQRGKSMEGVGRNTKSIRRTYGRTNKPNLLAGKLMITQQLQVKPYCDSTFEINKKIGEKVFNVFPGTLANLIQKTFDIGKTLGWILYEL